MAKAPSERISGEMGEIIDAVAGYANSGNAMGYSVYYYLTTMYSAENIRMLAAAGVAPSSQTIADGSYLYTNDFFAVSYTHLDVYKRQTGFCAAGEAVDWELKGSTRRLRTYIHGGRD